MPLTDTWLKKNLTIVNVQLYIPESDQDGLSVGVSQKENFAFQDAFSI